jgi:hypothetical protein
MSFLKTLPRKTRTRIISLYRPQFIANWVSHVINPPVAGLLAAIVFIVETTPTPSRMWPWLALTLPLISAPPLTYLIWLVRRGELADIHMPDRRTRLKPLGLMMLWAGICLLLLRYWQAPPTLLFILLIVVGYMAVLSTITMFWKISFHSTAISAAASIGIITGGITLWSVTIVLLVPVVGWARIYLHRHTVRQIIAGCLLGVGIGISMVII